MKITHIGAHEIDGTARVSLTVDVGPIDMVSAIASVAALFAHESGSRDAASPTSASVGGATADTTGPTAAEGTGTRQRRQRGAATPDASAATEPASNVTELGTRRRRANATAPAEAAPVTYTDADLSRAASTAAGEIVGFGFDGPGTLMDMMKKDYGVTDTSAIPPERREKFCADLREEVRLAELESKEVTA